MKLFAAIDGGGSRSELIVFGEDLKLRERRVGGALNFNEAPDAPSERPERVCRSIGSFIEVKRSGRSLGAFVRTSFTPEFPERATAAERYISCFAALPSGRCALKAT